MALDVLVDGDTRWAAECSVRSCRVTKASKARILPLGRSTTSTSYRDYLTRRSDHPHKPVAAVGDKYVPFSVDSNSAWLAELRYIRRTVGVPLDACACHRAYRPSAHAQPADHVVERVGDENLSVGVEHSSARTIKARRFTGPVAQRSFTRARHDGRCAIAVQSSYAIVVPATKRAGVFIQVKVREQTQASQVDQCQY